MTDHQNPWLAIPAADYEGHMSSDEVGQLRVLNRIFAETLTRFAPERLAVLGCSAGNGFEHIDPGITRRVVGIDVNRTYLDLLERRHGHRLTGLDLVCADLADCHFEAHSFDLIHAALIFEYVDPPSVLPKLVRWLRPNGVLSVVLQLPSPSGKKVSETPFTSLLALDSIMNLVEPDRFEELAEQCGLARLSSEEVDLKRGKRFHVAYYTVGQPCTEE